MLLRVWNGFAVTAAPRPSTDPTTAKTTPAAGEALYAFELALSLEKLNFQVRFLLPQTLQWLKKGCLASCMVGGQLVASRVPKHQLLRVPLH